MNKMTSARLFTLAALALTPAAAADLFSDDFSRFPVGRLTMPLGFTNPAIQEYHYLAHRGVPLGPWASAICHVDAWLVGEEDGKAYLEQSLGPDTRQFVNPIFLSPRRVPGGVPAGQPGMPLRRFQGKSSPGLNQCRR